MKSRMLLVGWSVLALGALGWALRTPRPDTPRHVRANLEPEGPAAEFAPVPRDQGEIVLVAHDEVVAPSGAPLDWLFRGPELPADQARKAPSGRTASLAPAAPRPLGPAEAPQMELPPAPVMPSPVPPRAVQPPAPSKPPGPVRSPLERPALPGGPDMAKTPSPAPGIKRLPPVGDVPRSVYPGVLRLPPVDATEVPAADKTTPVESATGKAVSLPPALTTPEPQPKPANSGPTNKIVATAPTVTALPKQETMPAAQDLRDLGVPPVDLPSLPDLSASLPALPPVESLPPVVGVTPTVIPLPPLDKHVESTSPPLKAADPYVVEPYAVQPYPVEPYAPPSSPLESPKAAAPAVTDNKPTVEPPLTINEHAAETPRNEPIALPLAPTPPAALSSEEVRRGMEAVRRRAAAHVKQGIALADRRAFYSARDEFIAALRLLAQGLEAPEGHMRRSDALAQGLWALQEAEGFMPRGAGMNADINVAQVASVHRTKVLKEAAARTTPLRALQQYYTFAQEQLGEAVKASPEGSQALSALGKLYVEMDKEPTRLAVDARTKGLVFQQAALLADPNNAKAANELGVMLAREGRHEEARDWLKHSAKLAPQAETWHNLAVVYQHLKEPRLAEAARQSSLALAPRDGQGRPQPVEASPRLQVRQVSPKEFAAQAPAPVDANAAPQRTAQALPASDTKKSSSRWNWLPWKR